MVAERLQVWFLKSTGCMLHGCLAKSLSANLGAHLSAAESKKGRLLAARSTMDLHLFDYSEPGNFSDISWPCNGSDCLVVDTVLCPNMPNKSVLLYTLSFIYIFIFVTGMIANSVVVWVNIQAKTTGYDTHCYILNLAIADLWVVVTIPVWVVSLVQHNQWPMGELTCKITHLIFSINLFGSIFFLTCMSVDRYLSIAYFAGTSSRRKKVVRRAVCALVWLLAFCVSLPDTYYLKTVTSASNNETYCRSFYPEHSVKEWLISMELVSVVLGFAIPFCIIAIFYCLLARAITASSDQEKQSSRKIIFSYVVVFLVCWLPYHVVVLLDIFSILHYVPFTCQLENFLFTALHVTQCLSLVHCCVNPVLYSFINRNYRYELMKAFIFKYSAKTGLTKLIDASRVSETEYSALEQSTK
ncbi:atypical chemokine receptor 3 isoform X1 [Zalophus californianus]|uniref:Atypical chemokine receptor 3 isoform X1 n=2 Tax=Zalophus californianus TaxID=9704 RepID=A0A6J2CSU4_ZALCA|nr:atypical chemokine receptor 3 isoform X1 [Zalophus californianus]